MHECENAFAFIFSLSPSLLYKQGHLRGIFKTAAQLRVMKEYITTLTTCTNV